MVRKLLSYTIRKQQNHDKNSDDITFNPMWDGKENSMCVLSIVIDKLFYSPSLTDARHGKMLHRKTFLFYMGCK